MRRLPSLRAHTPRSQVATQAIRIGLAWSGICDRLIETIGPSSDRPGLVGSSNRPARSPASSRRSANARSRPHSVSSSGLHSRLAAACGSGRSSWVTTSPMVGWPRRSVRSRRADASSRAASSRGWRLLPRSSSAIERSSASRASPLTAGSRGLRRRCPPRMKRIGVTPSAVHSRSYSPLRSVTSGT